MLNGLDFFSGIGGISLALSPWVRTVCYVETAPYCQAVLQARQGAGDLETAPIWDDVTIFDPEPWAGAVDIITGGFPCQDISLAGSGAGLAGECTGLFFEIIRCAGVIRPAFIFMENVPAIVGRGGRDVVGALAEIGYDARWAMLSAFDVGAPQIRERWWCLAHRAGGGAGPVPARSRGKGEGAPDPDRDGEAVAHAELHGRDGFIGDAKPRTLARTANRTGREGAGSPAQAVGGCSTVAHAEGSAERAGLRPREQAGERGRRPGDCCGEGHVSDAPVNEWSGNRSAHPGAPYRPALAQFVLRFPSPSARDHKSGKGRQPDNGHTPQLPEVIGG